MLAFWQSQVFFGSPMSATPKPPYQSPRTPLPANLALLKRPAWYRQVDPSLHLLSLGWSTRTRAGEGEQLLLAADSSAMGPVTLPLNINDTHRQHTGSMRGFHGDRTQAMTSVNVIRALGLVCETGLISPPVEALWSRPYIGFIHWQTTCYLHPGSSADGNPHCSRAASSTVWAGCRMQKVTRGWNGRHINTWHPCPVSVLRRRNRPFYGEQLWHGPMRARFRTWKIGGSFHLCSATNSVTLGKSFNLQLSTSSPREKMPG